VCSTDISSIRRMINQDVFAPAKLNVAVIAGGDMVVDLQIRLLRVATNFIGHLIRQQADFAVTQRQLQLELLDKSGHFMGCHDNDGSQLAVKWCCGQKAVDDRFAAVAFGLDGVVHLALVKQIGGELIHYRLSQHDLTRTGDMGNTGGVIDGIAEDIILSKQSRSEGNTDPDGETRQLRLIKTAMLDGAGSLTGLG